MTFESDQDGIPRIKEILDCCLKLASGDFSARLTPSEEDSEIESVVSAINMVGEEMEAFVAERELAEKHIEHLAYYDPLTDLPNRKLFFDRLNQAILRANRNNQRLALLYIDLDNFKNINDTLGHPMGDQLLVKVTERFQKNLRKNTTTSRMGGDEFATTAEDIPDVLNATRLAKRILNLFKKPYILDGREVFISTSIGIAVFPNDGETPLTLLKNADTAMYQAKKYGKNNYRFFSTGMNDEIEKRMDIENKLRHALENEEFSLFYQPKVDITQGEIVGMESLIRWNHRGIEEISPADFIPVAEETTLILDIDRWVLLSACKQMKIWQDAGYEKQELSVNISGLHFEQGRILKTVNRVLDETGLDPDCLELEITEGVLMKDVEKAIETLDRLRAIGLKISLDDFGTGYSSLSYLKRFPINKVKIDRCFVSGVMTDPDDAAITRTIIAMAKNLNLGVIAEGVEQKEQLDFLHSEGCNEIQGFLFSRPLPAEEFEKLLKEWNYSHRCC